MHVSDPARRVSECRVCGGSDWQQVLSLGSLPLANGFLDEAESYDDEPSYPLGVMSCRSCRLMSLTHAVDPETLFRRYPYVISGSETIRWHMLYLARVCQERFRLPLGSLVVEIGSNTGAHLMVFRNAGMRTLGVDPARNLAAIAEEHGIRTLPEFFSAATARRIAKEYGPARLLLGRHVLAHIDDLASALAGARQLLASDGVFVIEVPYLMDLLDKVAFDTIYHEHLSYFMVSTLDILFRRHGLAIVDVERVPVHCGSLLVFAGHPDGPWSRRRSVGELRAAEQRAGLHDDAIYRTFARRVNRVREELPALVRGLVNDGKHVAGYGAPAKGNMILNVCGLGRGELSFCSDTTRLKQNKVLPGSHIPVRTPEHARRNPPDYYLLLAWNYAEEILRKEAGFLDRGGKFILPVPEPTIVSAASRAPARSGTR